MNILTLWSEYKVCDKPILLAEPGHTLSSETKQGVWNNMDLEELKTWAVKEKGMPEILISNQDDVIETYA